MTQQSHAATSATANHFGFASVEKPLMNMLGYMEDLTELYNEELNALTLRDMKKFAEIQPAKTRLVMSCEASMNEIQKQPALLKAVSPALKERVFLVENTLSQLAQKSQRECQIRAESMRRVQQRLLDAARHLMNKDKNKYNNRGQTDFAKVKATATAINEAI